MRDSNPITGLVGIIRNQSVKQTREALVMLAKIPESPEKKALLSRLKTADEKIRKQLDFVEKLDRLLKKYT